MNTKIINGISYKYEGYWRKNKNDKLFDSKGNLYQYPISYTGKWYDKDNFINKLFYVQDFLFSKNKYNKTVLNSNDCIICNEKNISTCTYNLNNIIWEDGLIHYIQKHSIKPSIEFIDIIFKFNDIPKHSQRTTKYETMIINKNDKKYLKLERNQIMIMDALMRHGGYSRKYTDKNNKSIFRYSEHSGLLDFDNFKLDKIMILGKTNRVDEGDSDIFLPKNTPEAFDYEYIFHTHPPTPKPGGRANVGILYEFPSMSDVFHFIDHFNGGNTQGSLVITPEGMYNIRKLNFDKKKIQIDEDNLFEDMRKTMMNAQKKAIKKYGTDFTSYEFYSKIAQDHAHIDLINKTINKYDIQIDYYARIRDEKGNWVIDTIYLPISVN